VNPQQEPQHNDLIGVDHDSWQTGIAANTALPAVTGNVSSQELLDMWYILMSLCTPHVFARIIISIVRVTEILEEETDIVVYTIISCIHYSTSTQRYLDMIKLLKPKVNQIHV
jgi:hypothetical protein